MPLAKSLFKVTKKSSEAACLYIVNWMFTENWMFLSREMAKADPGMERLLD